MLTKLNQGLFYFFILLLPWQTILILKEVEINNEKFQYGTIGIYLFEIILLIWVLSNILVLKNYSDKKILFSILSFASFSALSILWSDDKLLSFYFLFPILLGSFLFLILQKKVLIFKNITFAFIFSASLHGILGLYQFLSQNSFSNKWLGISEHIAWQGGSSVIEVSTGRFLRAYGAMPHPNILGGLLLITILLGIGAYLKTSSFEKKWRYFLIATITINFFSLLSTFSRSSFLALSFGLILFFAYNVYNNKKYQIKALLMFLGVFFIIGFIFFSSFSELLMGRMQANSRLERKSVNERSLLVHQAQKIIVKNPIIGIGIGNYTHVLLKNNPDIKKNWLLQPVHNVYLLIFAELGAIGFSLFLFIVIFMIYNFIESFKKEDSNRVIFSVITVSLLLIALFDHWLWTTHFGVIAFWLLISFSREKDLTHA
ncbi:MAG: hypothetical protein ACD_7C00086G0031 [uncultured bacterium]|nr:MAG: hypothetical protein ACD_7C00086G0031 [uncultured bacterium]HBR79759.1 hypothetical protein [Candidatus Moranbacteria bacterium]